MTFGDIELVIDRSLKDETTSLYSRNGCSSSLNMCLAEGFETRLFFSDLVDHHVGR